MFKFVLTGTVEPSTTLGTIIVVTGSFLLLMLLIKKFAWHSITELLKKREEKISNDLDSAEQAKISANKLEKERQQQLLSSKSEAADIIKNARENGEQNRQKMLTETKAEISRLHEKSKNDILQEHEEAMASIKNEVADLSIQIAEKILSKELSPEAHDAMINSYIESLGNADETR